MVDQSSEVTSVENNDAVDKKRSAIGWKIQLGALCIMLVLALGGMALTQASEKGAWEYWLFVVIVYAALGLWRTTRQAKQAVASMRKLLARQIAHWATLLGFLAVLLLLERVEIITRQSASDFAVMMLALACCLAGIHFDWLLMIVGVALTAMLVAMALLQQYTFVLWIVMIVVVVGAAFFFYFTRGKRSDTELKD